MAVDAIRNFFKNIDFQLGEPATRDKAIAALGMLLLASTFIVCGALAHNANKIEQISGQIRDIDLKDFSDEDISWEEFMEFDKQKINLTHQLTMLQTRHTTMVGMAVITGFLGFTATTAGIQGLRQRPAQVQS